MTCDHCASAVRAEISKLPGIVDVDVDVAAGIVRITGELLPGDTPLREAVEEAGYKFPARPGTTRHTTAGRSSGVRGRRRPDVLASIRAAALPLACVCVAACGSGSPAAASPAWEVRSGVVRGLGTIVTDSRGFTLYIYVPDRQGPSVCTGVCAVQWPPLAMPRGIRRPVAGPGVNPALLGTTQRAGGVLQVTYNRWPLYLWQGDLAPGQAAGQAEDMGAWYTLSVGGSVDDSRCPEPGLVALPSPERRQLLTLSRRIAAGCWRFARRKSLLVVSHC